MSELSISTDTIQSIGLENQISGPESLTDRSTEIATGVSESGIDRTEQAVAGLELRSRTEEFFGSGTDFSSTGTDTDIQTAISNTLNTGIGSISDELV